MLIHIKSSGNYLIALLISFSLISCKEKKQAESHNWAIGLVDTIVVSNDNKMPFESFVKRIEICPLENSPNAFIGQISSMYASDYYYIFNMPSKLSVFSRSGNFVRNIANKGKGPGEYNLIYDFQVDNNENVYITDAGKIRKYDHEGKWLHDISLDSLPAMFKFIDASHVFSDENFYMWKNDERTDLFKPNNSHYLYKVERGKNVTEFEIPTTAATPSIFPRFTNSSDTSFLVIPPWWENNIYEVSLNSGSIRYHVDFGSHELDREFLAKIGEKSYFENRAAIKNKHWGIRNFWNKNNYVFFSFISSKGMLATSIFNKKSRQTFVNFDGTIFNLPVIFRCLDQNDDAIIATIEPINFNALKNIVDKNFYNFFSESDRNVLNNLSDSDNTIILRLILK